MSQEATSPAVDWSTFGADRPLGWLATFDGRSLDVSGESAFGLASTASTPHWSVHFDGLLHNIEELIRILKPERTKTNPAQLIGLAFEKWGESLLDKIHGVFSVLIWDKRKGELLAARDPVGIFPLFYTSRENIWYFSTSLNVLRSDPAITTEINRSFLTSWISFVWPSPNHTAYSHIFRVRSGFVLTVRGGQGSERRYWDLIEQIDNKGWVTPEEADYFIELLQYLVERYLGYGSVGIYLSGGLDSVGVAAFAAEMALRWGRQMPRALSVEFTDVAVNESAIQRSVAQQLGLPQRLVPLDTLAGPRGTVRESLDLASTFESPTSNMWLAAYMNLGAMAVEDGCGVLLTGGGGDEWLGVTPVYAADLMLKGDFPGLYRLLKSYHRSFCLSPLATWRNVLWRFSLRPMLGDHAARYAARLAPEWLAKRHKRDLQASYPPWLAVDADLRAQISEQLDAFIAEREAHRYDTTPYLRELLIGLDHPLTSLEHETVFEEGRRVGAPILSPYLDSRMIEFLARTPPELLNTGDRAKGLVREALSRRFPEVGFERQKKVGFGTFHETTVFQGVFRSWQEIGGPRALSSLGIVSGERAGKAARSLMEGDHKQMLPWQMQYLLYVEGWTREHIA